MSPASTNAGGAGGRGGTGGTRARAGGHYRRPHDSAAEHRDWLALVDTSGPFLSLPVLRATWQSLDGLDPHARARLRRAHAAWQSGGPDATATWLRYVLADLLEWGDALHGPPDPATTTARTPGGKTAASVDATVRPDTAAGDPGDASGGTAIRADGTMPETTVQPGTGTAEPGGTTDMPTDAAPDNAVPGPGSPPDATAREDGRVPGVATGGAGTTAGEPKENVPVGDLTALAVEVPEHETTLVPDFALVEPDEDVKPATAALVGLVCEAAPTARVPGSAWSATPVDRLAHLCRATGVELGLATDGRWWTLVWARPGEATATATFDAISWHESADLPVVRALVSLLRRRRFFAVPAAERLPALLRDSAGSGEDITEALGVNVRRAVELLVAAIGRAGVPAQVPAHEVYRAGVAVMMRVVFLLFAEERGLLPTDNELYAASYSVGRLAGELERQAQASDSSEEHLEHSTAAWHRLLAVFAAVHGGVRHEQLANE